MKKMILGMSGGVDSSTAAFLSAREGYDVIGVTHIVCGEGYKAAEDAAEVCRALGIPHITQDLREVFRREVIEYFVSSYENGLTPNPCVMCNKTVKFPYLFDKLSEGDVAATGHYARIEKSGDRFLLKKGKDEKKDQSYVLWNLKEEQLSQLVFPLGDYTKEEIREIAREMSLPSAESRESQDICFIPDGDYAAFIERYRGRTFERGNYTDEDGKILGVHTGHMNYTPGQRRGLGIALGHHMYVLRKDAAANTVVLGEREKLFVKTVKAKSINLIAAGDIERPQRFEVKIRYGRTVGAATVVQSGEDELCAVFDSAVCAPAPGQSLVIYDGDTVIGGGVISEGF